MKLRIMIIIGTFLMSFHAFFVGMSQPLESVDTGLFYVYQLCKDGNANGLRNFLNPSLNQPFISPSDAPVSCDDDFRFENEPQEGSVWDKISAEELRENGSINLLLTVQDEEGNTPLHIACRSNHYECVELLVQQDGLDVNVKNEKGKTPLLVACENNAAESVKFLLQKQDVDVNETCDNYDGFEGNSDMRASPLYCACQKNNIQIASLLMSHENIHLDTEIRNESFYEWIIDWDAKELFEWLLSNKSEYLHSIKDFAHKGLNIINGNGYCEDPRFFIEKIISFITKEQLNALVENNFLLIIIDKHLPLLLARSDIDVTLCNDFYYTAFDHAFFSNKTKAIKSLLNHCANNQQAKLAISNIICLRMQPNHYAQYLKYVQYEAKSKEFNYKELNNPAFFIFLFNRFAYQGIESLDIEVGMDECSICADKLAEHSFVVKLGCVHIFGVTCLSKSMAGEQENSCPVCSKDILGTLEAINIIVGFPISSAQKDFLGKRGGDRYGSASVFQAAKKPKCS